jgi:hypothetical protein
MRQGCWLAVLIFGLPASVPAAVYHVAQTSAASDENQGSEAAPWRTISRSLAGLAPGDTVVIHKGVYREWVAPKVSGTAEKPITFTGAPDEEVILTGADAITEWERVAGDRPIYAHKPWTYRFIVAQTPEGQPIFHHPGDERHKLIGRAEQVVVDEELLEQVLRLDQMGPGTFFADLDGKTLYVWLPKGADPRQHEVQASTRQLVFGQNPWTKQGVADFIRLQNVTIRYAANFAQRGPLWVGGDGWRIEDVVVEWTNGSGVSLGGKGLRVKNLISRHNGQMGMGGSPREAVLEDVQLLDNNRKGFDSGWEAGGMKFSLACDVVLRRVEAARNGGPGIWFDIDNRKCTVTQCFVHDNVGSGIMVEISGREGFTITDNLCVANGLKKESGWGSAGILLAESRQCTVERNLCLGNREGIAIRMQEPRPCPSQELQKDGSNAMLEYVTGEHVIRRNVLAFNQQWQLAFWGDNPFFGSHPSAGADQGKPPIDPEKLNLTIDSNLYFARPKQGLILYGPDWRPKHQKFTDLAAWRQSHPFDRGSVFADPQLVAPSKGDYRLRRTSPAYRLKAVPENIPMGKRP